MTQLKQGPGICFGQGRSYGDICLNPEGVLWTTSGLDRFIDFDPDTGILHCEAGVLLSDIQRIFVPRGWMLPVTPGTQFVTVGGAIANDVHGKNHHHFGTFGEQVKALTLQRCDGQQYLCTADGERSDWFQATVGGMGLTGVIINAQLQLRKVASPWLHADTRIYGDLTEFFRLAEESIADWEYSVAWVDCLSGRDSRGIFLRANHADSSPKPGRLREQGRGRLTMPITPPISLVNRLTLKPFNSLYYALNARRCGARLAHYESFFYPLDGINHWNRMYGRKGFYQYQCVVPQTDAHDAVAALLAAIKKSGDGSFLAVLKTFGQRRAAGLLSFPMAGTTLALDFPNNGSRSLKLFETLDTIVSEAGGRLYPAKDARMSPQMFATGYPRLQEFISFRDPGISSAMSRRLLGS